MTINRRILGPGLMISASLVVCILVLELALRLAGAEIIPKPTTAFIRPSDISELVYDLKPNSMGPGALQAMVSVNSDGFRDREYEPEKGNHFRILALGDSITFGAGLQIEQIYAKQLENRLRRRFNGIDVINLGVPGYNTVDEATFLSARGLRYQPDLLVLGFCVNDAGIMSGQVDYIRARRYLDGTWAGHSRVARLLVRGYFAVSSDVARLILARNTRLLSEKDVIVEYRGRFAEANLQEDGQLAQLVGILKSISIPSTETGKDWGVTEWYESKIHLGLLEAGFAKIKLLSKQYGFRVVVLIFPFLKPDSLQTRWGIVHEILRHEARKHGFDSLDLLPEFRKAGLEKIQMTTADPIHPNAFGHSLATRLLENYVRGVIARKPES